MKLLIDAMYWPAVGHQLVARGHDAVAAIERADLKELPDDELFAAAQLERRAVVTENVADFVPIAQRYAAEGVAHFGLILVPPSAYPRDRANRNATLGRLVNALDSLAQARPGEDEDSFVHWL